MLPFELQLPKEIKRCHTGLGFVAQLVQCILSMHQVLGSISSTT